MIANKQLAGNIIHFAKEKYGISCAWPRTMALLNRLEYKYIIKSALNIPEKTKFKDGDSFLNYIQKVATELQLKEMDK